MDIECDCMSDGHLFFLWFNFCCKNDDEYEGQCQPVVIQHMDIAQPLSTLRRLLEAQLNISLNDYEFWLQDSIKVLSLDRFYFIYLPVSMYLLCSWVTACYS